MSTESQLDGEAAAELHNRIANSVVAQILDDPVAGGGSLSDVILLLESVMVGVIGSIFTPEQASGALDAITGRARARLALLRVNRELGTGRPSAPVIRRSHH